MRNRYAWPSPREIRSYARLKCAMVQLSAVLNSGFNFTARLCLGGFLEVMALVLGSAPGRVGDRRVTGSTVMNRKDREGGSNRRREKRHGLGRGAGTGPPNPLHPEGPAVLRRFLLRRRGRAMGQSNWSLALRTL